MSYRIIGDSCMELTDEMKESGLYRTVPLTLQVGTEEFLDDESFDQRDFLDRMKNSEECPKSSCPSPEAFEREFKGVREIYVVTLSSQLSGCYNSASLARMDYLGKHGSVKIAVIDSKSASIGETLLGRKIEECKKKGMDFSQTVAEVEAYRDSIQTKFVLETLDVLKKNGRLTGVTAVICETLNIKPIMKGTEEGSIEKMGQMRGMKGALNKMIASIKEDVFDAEHRTLMISHCNNRKRAEFVKEQIEKIVNFSKIIILDTRGVSTMYANDGGIIVAY